MATHMFHDIYDNLFSKYNAKSYIHEISLVVDEWFWPVYLLDLWCLMRRGCLSENCLGNLALSCSNSLPRNKSWIEKFYHGISSSTIFIIILSKERNSIVRQTNYKKKEKYIKLTRFNNVLCILIQIADRCFF